MINIIAGRAHINGVSFQTKRYYAITTLKKGEIRSSVRERGNRVSHFYEKIPFLRGAILPIEMIFSNIEGIILLMINIVTYGLVEYRISHVSTGNLLLVLAIFLTLVGVFIKLTGIGKYHAAEHMAYDAYQKNEDLTIENVAKHSRISASCGTNLVMFVLLFVVVGNLIIPNIWITLFLSFAVGYEVYRIERGFIRKIVSPLYMLGGAVQWLLFTSQPSQKELEVAIRAIKELEEAERS